MYGWWREARNCASLSITLTCSSLNFLPSRGEEYTLFVVFQTNVDCLTFAFYKKSK